MFWSSRSQSASSYVRSNATWHRGATGASARRPASALVLSHEVPAFRARETAAPAAARPDHASDRCAGLLRPASRTGARTVSDDRATLARGIRTPPLVLRTAFGDTVLSGRNVSR